MKIRFGYTPDTDDAFHYFALEKRKVGDGRRAHFEFFHRHIQELNDMALAGELEVSAVSSIVYPQIADRYALLSAGSSVGRGYGPVLGVKAGSGLKDLRNKTVGVPGKFTTGYFLANYFYEGFRPVLE
jgi:1,4-dihydroxy-6-naphthoate synthase